jgi:hypothetical protein
MPIGDKIGTGMDKLVVFVLCIILLIVMPTAAGGSPGEAIGSVVLSTDSFNPTRGEKLRLAYNLAQSDRVTIRIYDPDGGLVRTLIEEAPRQSGKQEEAWDGRDDDGLLVPNEAFMFTVETLSRSVYDPMTFSGGVVGDVTDAHFDAGTLSYNIPKASRVLIRLGLHNGPMLKTLVDWQPRTGGSITEYWDGYDENKLVILREHKDFSTLITFVTLPDTTVITYGNESETYRNYKLGRAKNRTQKVDRPYVSDPSPGRARPVGLVPPAWAHAPRPLMTLLKYEAAASEIPTVGNVVDVHVAVAPDDIDYLLRDQFEIIFFVDGVFFAEAERGYLPFNWSWESMQIPPGEHVLTVNISSFKGQVGVASRKVKLVKEGR